MNEPTNLLPKSTESVAKHIDFSYLDPRTFKCKATLEELEKKTDRAEKEQELYVLLSYFKKIFCIYDSLKSLFSHTSYYFDWDSKEMEFWEWAFKFEFLPKYVKDEFTNGFLISTVWLGSNHSFIGDLLIFETMIFDKSGNSVYMNRYSTYEEALEGHKKACELAKIGKFHE